MMTFMLILLAPVAVSVVAYFWAEHAFTRNEFLVQVSASILVAGLTAWWCYQAQTDDIELRNGRVTSKARERVSCDHSYQCNCRQSCSGSGKNRSCSTVCDTCYEHSSDYDWVVRTTVGSVTINRVDRQGVRQPPRFARVVAGEPATLEYTYTNYIKGASDTLFADNARNLKGPSLTHPRVYDYYRVRPVLGVGVPVSGELQDALREVNARLGSQKQVNIVLVVTSLDKAWTRKLEAEWLGGKKNDVVVVAGVPQAGAPVEWAHVFAWSKHELFKVELRDKLIGAELTPATVTGTIASVIHAGYERKPMKDFEYLSASVQPSVGQLAVAIIVNTVIAILLALTFTYNQHKENHEQNRRHRRRPRHHGHHLVRRLRR